ncbi:MAG TPA: hypothetical protein VMS22_01050 [Candidatus Eisenbacteria bacterium]|nr:hypothetical protein [Candidatus Eisenbacteria bacterium]
MTPVTIAIFFVGLALVVVVAVFVAAPLFGAPELTVDPAAPSERERWERQKRQAIAAIKETELDHQMGKLSQEDFDRMRARFEGQALEAMAALERGGRR